MIASQLEMNFAFNDGVKSPQEACEVVGALVSVDSATFEQGKALFLKRIAVPKMDGKFPSDDEIAEYYARR